MDKELALLKQETFENGGKNHEDLFVEEFFLFIYNLKKLLKFSQKQLRRLADKDIR